MNDPTPTPIATPDLDGAAGQGLRMGSVKVLQQPRPFLRVTLKRPHNRNEGTPSIERAADRKRGEE